MKRNWLLYLVIFSLALNFGTIGALAYLHYQDRQAAGGKEESKPVGLRDLWRALHLDPEQRQALRQLVPEHRRQVAQMRQELVGKRQELFALLKGENPDWDAVQAKIKEISAQQSRLEEEVVRFLLECRKHLRPEQQAAFVNLVERRLCRPWNCGPMGRGPWGHGRMRGNGPGPAPAAPPKSP